ncbi:MAG: hypothetical protein IPJ51_06780 [Saprospiraceae bacterium]|nr:hypothetical protein [Saprospiraceae bacterium]
MKKILINIGLLILNLNLSGQMEIKNNLTDLEIKEIKLEFESVQANNHKLALEFKVIDKINIAEFLNSSFDKELALLAKQKDAITVIQFTEHLIEIIDSNQNLFFIPENNVFLNLYKKATTEIEQQAITEILRSYLSKCQDIYYINWLYGLNLLSKYDTKSNINNLAKSKFDKIDPDHLFEVIYFLMPSSDKNQLDKWIGKINNDISNPSHKISLLYQLIKNCELTNSQQEQVVLILDRINSSEINYDIKACVETIRYDINSEHQIPLDYLYSFSNTQIIQFLRSDLKKEIPNYVEHLIDVKFVGTYFRRNEAILSWILKYSETASSYYAQPEQIALLDNKFYNEVFQFVFSDLKRPIYSYLIQGYNQEQIKLKTLVDKTLYSKSIVFNDTMPVGYQIEEYINDIHKSEESVIRLNQVSFDYPMFICETKENYLKLKTKFNLKE